VPWQKHSSFGFLFAHLGHDARDRHSTLRNEHVENISFYTFTCFRSSFSIILCKHQYIEYVPLHLAFIFRNTTILVSHTPLLLVSSFHSLDLGQSSEDSKIHSWTCSNHFLCLIQPKASAILYISRQVVEILKVEVTIPNSSKSTVLCSYLRRACRNVF